MMKTRVLLINPHIALMAKQNIDYSDYFPAEFCHWQQCWINVNIDVKIIDGNNIYVNSLRNDGFEETVYLNDLGREIKDFRPDIVAIGCMFSGSFKGLLSIARVVKEVSPSTPVVTGGIHPTIYPREILQRYDCIDYVLTGEAEDTFPTLIDAITSGNTSILKELDGMAFRDKRDVTVNVKRNFISDVDTIPFINYNLIDVNDYRMDTSKWYSPKGLKVGIPYPIISSRSCPQKCNFCSMWQTHGKTIRSRSPKNVVDEIENLYHEFGARFFQFMDDNLTFEKNRTIEMCEEIVKRNLNIQFDTPNGVALNKLDNDIIAALVGAGLTRISIAIESGSEYIRNKVIKKGLRTDKIYENTLILADYDELFINAFFIVGFPEETSATLADTYHLIQNLPLDKFFVAFPAPYPGTRLFQYCIENNLLPGNYEDWVENPDLQPKAEMPHFKPHELEITDLINFRKQCYSYLTDKRKKSDVPYNYPLRYYRNWSEKPNLSEAEKSLPSETLSSNKEWYTPALSGSV